MQLLKHSCQGGKEGRRERRKEGVVKFKWGIVFKLRHYTCRFKDIEKQKTLGETSQRTYISITKSPVYSTFAS